jgi:hypothetical protein
VVFLHRVEIDGGTRRSALGHYIRDQTGPSGLMRRPETGGGVSVEIFMKEKKITEMWTHEQIGMATEHRPTPVVIDEKDGSQSVCQPIRDFPQ